jgi:hypothetical protein
MLDATGNAQKSQTEDYEPSLAWDERRAQQANRSEGPFGQPN